MFKIIQNLTSITLKFRTASVRVMKRNTVGLSLWRIDTHGIQSLHPASVGLNTALFAPIVDNPV